MVLRKTNSDGYHEDNPNYPEEVAADYKESANLFQSNHHKTPPSNQLEDDKFKVSKVAWFDMFCLNRLVNINNSRFGINITNYFSFMFLFPEEQVFQEQQLQVGQRVRR